MIKRTVLIIVVLSILTLFGEIGQVVWLPLWLDSTSIDKVGNNATSKDTGTYATILITAFFNIFGFFIIYQIFSKQSFFVTKTVFKAGCFNSVGGILTPYLSSSSRNTPMTQALLINTFVPLTVVLRLFWFNKIPTKKKIILIAIIVGALMFSFIPDFFGMSEISSKYNWEAHIIWVTLLLISSILFPAIVNIYIEQIYKENETDTSLIEESNDKQNFTLNHSEKPDIFLFCLVISLIDGIASIFFFWIDIIPQFGYSDNLPEFFTNFGRSFICSFGARSCNRQTVAFAFAFNISKIVALLFGTYLIQYSEGSIFWALNSNLISPCSCIFWMLFRPTPLRFKPHFAKYNIFTLVGAVIILPTLIYYSYNPEERNVYWVIKLKKYIVSKIRQIPIFRRCQKKITIEDL